MPERVMPLWPRQLDFVRHAESTYNWRQRQQEHLTLYQDFLAAYDQDPTGPTARRLAEDLVAHYAELAGDNASPITDEGRDRLVQLGQVMSAHQPVPDVIFVSPYLRTKQSLLALIKGWPALTSARIIEEDRIREREFGLRILYGDRQVFECLHPEQRQLRQLQGDYWYRPPQGENIPDVRQRLRSWSTTLTRRFPGQHVLAMSHHLVILAFRANVERLTAEQFLQLDDTATPNNGSMTTFRGEFNRTTGQQRLRMTEYKYDA